MDKIIRNSIVRGHTTLFINSKRPITQEEIQRLVPANVKVVVEGPRVLWNDVKESLPLHITVVLLTCGVGLLGYAGFWIYERWKPLYIVYLDLNELEKFVNPLFEVKIDTVQDYD
jgi:hypothetical protein